MDFSGRAKKPTRDGKNCYGVAVDAYSLSTVARLETNETNGVELLKEWIRRGVPDEIRVDGARTFRSNEFMKICDQHNITVSVRSPYTPNQCISRSVHWGHQYHGSYSSKPT